MLVFTLILLLLAQAPCETIEAAAATAYLRLKAAFSKSENYWQLGNAFDTMTDYALSVWSSHPDPALAVNAYAKYEKVRRLGCWYDDYLWWGISATKSFDSKFDKVFGALKSSYQSIARETWGIAKNGKNDSVHFGAPFVYLNRDNRTFFRPPIPPVPPYWAAPRFDSGIGSGLHGVWQYDIFHNRRVPPQWIGPKECTVLSPPEAANPLGPYQDTVVNGLFWVLSLRLAELESDARQASIDETGFLFAWFGLDDKYPIRSEESLLERFPDSSLLVRERVSSYALHKGEYPPVQNWDLLTAWGGDQGLILGGLIDLLDQGTLSPNVERSTMKQIARNLTLGVSRYLVEGPSGALYPWYPTNNNKLEKWDRQDYKCGNGVFMRYLRYSYLQKDSPIASVVETNAFQLFLCKAAQNISTIVQKDMFDSLNVLATLLAAQDLLLHPAHCVLPGIEIRRI